VRQVGYLQSLYRDVRSTEHKIILTYYTAHKETCLDSTYAGNKKTMIMTYLNRNRCFHHPWAVKLYLC